ncbi:M23 family metallopeptidase [Pseudoclavibacter caeni]|jgi:murein DD-endopeptidase MepM/ murein hydrolase activator NlpD|nr:M23 family metallopeptidase [Pseudoclavibacter caeni]NYJ97541.1 murein DD-endopeptidase MepM/ murein hydrolase activator NlpD [Pseudoclavibacter caeni]
MHRAPPRLLVPLVLLVTLLPLTVSSTRASPHASAMTAEQPAARTAASADQVGQPFRTLDALLTGLLPVATPAAPLTATPVEAPVASARSTASAPPGLPSPAPCVELPCWSWPVARPSVIEAFRAPPHRYGAGHRGVDLAAAAGDAVLAVADGTVTFAGRVVDRPVVTVSHEGGWRSSHEAVEPAVTAGDAVRRGQVIGHVVAGPHCADRCLHLGARHGEDYHDPVLLIEGAVPSVLLPLP